MSQPSLYSRLARPSLLDVQPYVPGPTIAEAAAKYDVPVEKIIKLSSNENPLGPPPGALQAVDDALVDLHRYPDSRHHAVRRAIAEREGLAEENVMMGAGSTMVMSHIIRAFTAPGDEILAMDPSYPVYAEIAAAEDRRFVTIPLQDPFELTLEAIAAAVTERTRILFVTRPNNPTSRLVPLPMLREIIRTLPNTVVISDEAYIEFADDFREQTAATLVREGANVIVTRTLSKAFGMPSLRVGYGLAPADAVSLATRLESKWCIGDVAQYAAVGALGDTAHFEKTLGVVHAGRRYLREALADIPGITVVPDPQANYLMLGVVGTGLVASEIVERMGREGILIRAAEDAHGQYMRDWLRISVGTMPENEACVAALRRVVAAGDRTDGADTLARAR